MKKLTFLSVILVSAILSCKKSNSSSSSTHLTATVGGTAKTFDTAALANKSSIAGTDVITIMGYNNPSSGEGVNFTIDNSSANGKPIVAGTYTDTSSTGFHVGFTYVGQGQATWIGSTSTAADAAGAQITIKNHLKIVITSVDATSIKGSFSGDLYPNGDVTGTPLTVTNGDFYVKFQ